MLLQKKFLSDKFLRGVELVTGRGIVGQESLQKVLKFGEDLAENPEVDWISVTDNAGGNPAMGADYYGDLLHKKGAEVLIHFSAKDMNRNGIESRLWELATRGLNNVLALTGDYPVNGFKGISRPVFDFDSICLLEHLNEMNKGLKNPGRKKGSFTILDKTCFFCGAVVSPFKKLESELAGQYLKLERKIRAGAEFVITQIGYDVRKWHELKLYLDEKNIQVPLVGYVYLLNRGVSRVFHGGLIPGCVVSDELFEKIQGCCEGPDRGRDYCLEFAAKQIAVLKGLGYRGVYLGGVTKIEQVESIFNRAESFAPDDWKEFAKEIQFPQRDEFFIYERDPVTRLADPARKTTKVKASIFSAPSQEMKNRSLSGADAPLFERISYKNSCIFHDWCFEPGTFIFKIGSLYYRFIDKHPFLSKVSYLFERIIKRILFDCRECGDCSLPDTNYLCPESMCKKRQRNGPCGGSLLGVCEVNDRKCIWVRAYNRSRKREEFIRLFERPAVFVNDSLSETSSWSNMFLGRDHNRYLIGEKEEDSQE